MKKNIKDFAMRAGMTGMAALSMAGALAGTAFAAEPTKDLPTAKVAGTQGTDSTAHTTYYDEDGTAEYDGEDKLFNVTDGVFGNKVTKATRVVVDQASTVAVVVLLCSVLCYLNNLSLQVHGHS